MFNFTEHHDQQLIAIVHDADCTSDSKLGQWCEDNGADFCDAEDRLCTLGYNRCCRCEYWYADADLEDTDDGPVCAECENGDDQDGW